MCVCVCMSNNEDVDDDDALELGSLNEAEMKELIKELEDVDVTDGDDGDIDNSDNDNDNITDKHHDDDDTASSMGKAAENDNHPHQIYPDSDFTNDSVMSGECNDYVVTATATAAAEGPVRVTVDTSASTEAITEAALSSPSLPSSLPADGVGGDVDLDGNDNEEEDDLKDLSLLETMCDLSNRALTVHAEIIAARDSMSAIQGAVCFAPSSAREIEDVQMVRDVAEKLPFLFTHQEAQGYLSCSVPRRYASIAMARDLHAICTSIDRECALCEDDGADEEDEEDEEDAIMREGNSERAEETEKSEETEECEDEESFHCDDFGHI